MKRLLFFFVVSSIIAAISGQVTLEHTYEVSGTLTEIDKNEFKYYVMDVPLLQCRIYNEDHTPFKTINLDVPSGYTLSDIKFVTKHLFNTDDNIELLYMYYKTSTIESELVYQYGLRIVDELGTLLLDLNNGGFAEINEGSDGMKLLAYQYIYSNSTYLVYTNVYALGGTVKAALAETDPGFKIYPNPASEIVSITMNPWEQIKKGQVMITDISGRTVNKKDIEPGSNFTSLETGWMSPGTYIMSILSKEKIIASEKFEIK